TGASGGGACGNPPTIRAAYPGQPAPDQRHAPAHAATPTGRAPVEGEIMSNTSGTAANPDTTPATQHPNGPGVPAPAAAVLAVVSLAWLAAMLWSGQRAVSSAGAATMVITSTALALPVVISASLVSGAATGLVVANLFTLRGVTGATVRFGGAVGAALLTGVLAAVAVALWYGDGPIVMVLAGTIAAAVTLGGSAGGL